MLRPRQSLAMAWLPLFVLSLTATASAFFILGHSYARPGASAESDTYEADAGFRQAESLQPGRRPLSDRVPMGISTPQTTDEGRHGVTAGDETRAKVVTEIKQELQNEMGLLPLQLLRDRRSSFVELYATDTFGETSYGTAGYLGDGYFITVKHIAVALKQTNQRDRREIVDIKVRHRGTEEVARLVDMGDADVEVHSGDWAVVRTTPLDIPALNIDHAFAYDFAEPIFRLGNDYSKGIIVSTGYVGQRTSTGLVTSLTDGHPGVSGGGVLDRQGNLVGIPIGRIQGDFRFSFILPLRAEMFRKVPHLEHLVDPARTVVQPR